MMRSQLLYFPCSEIALLFSRCCAIIWPNRLIEYQCWHRRQFHTLVAMLDVWRLILNTFHCMSFSTAGNSYSVWLMTHMRIISAVSHLLLCFLFYCCNCFLFIFFSSHKYKLNESKIVHINGACSFVEIPNKSNLCRDSFKKTRI